VISAAIASNFSLPILLADGVMPSSAGSLLSGPLPIIVMFGIFYFLLIRPQQKKQRELQEWLKSIKKGDEVVTTGGLWGKVLGIADNTPYVTLELQEKVRVRVLRSHITGKAPTTVDQASQHKPKPPESASSESAV
jgi:preprotein translocase subunit YajC